MRGINARVSHTYGGTALESLDASETCVSRFLHVIRHAVTRYTCVRESTGHP